MIKTFVRQATSRWEDVTIKEVDTDTVKVYRKKVKKDKLQDYAKSLLEEALRLIQEGQETNENMALYIPESVDELTSYLVERSNIKLPTTDMNRKAIILDKIKTAYAITQYLK